MTRVLARIFSFTVLSVFVVATLAMSDQAVAKKRNASQSPRNVSQSPGSKIVSIDKKYPLGAIVIVNNERKLYYSLGNGRAIRYPVAIGTPKNQWTGESFVQGKRKNPSWTPPWNPRRRVRGGPGNPLGVRALYLGWTLYRIHGTTAPSSIGRAASHGCIRMHNKDVKDLYERVHIGAPVFVIKKRNVTSGNS